MKVDKSIVILALIFGALYWIKKNRPQWGKGIFKQKGKPEIIEYDVKPRPKPKEPVFTGIITSTGSTNYC